MTRWTLAHRGTAAAICAALLASATPSHAQGFLEQLFGGGTHQPAQPTFDYQSGQPLSPDIHIEPYRSPRKKVIVANVDPATQRQKTTDLWHDKTLRPGDAIMMKDGLHVYNGPEAAKHSAKQFVPLVRARVASKKTKAALIAMAEDPLRKELAPDTLASGRSAAVGTAVTEGFRITDARGASVRYVGP